MTSQTNHKTNAALVPVCSKNELIAKWMEDSEFDAESCVSSEISTTGVSDENESFENLKIADENPVKVTNNGIDVTSSNAVNILQKIFTANNNVQKIGNIQLKNTKNVHIGNIINITGSIQIINSDDEAKSRKDSYARLRSKMKPESSNLPPDLQQNCEPPNSKNDFKLYDRNFWLARPEKDPKEPLPEHPAPYVIICHTATEPANTVKDSIFLLQAIQGFHMDSRDWDDIAYHFLIGDDGSVYEGRGWGVIGAHTIGYNKNSIAIAFIGCFMRELPNSYCLEACKKLIKRGVELKQINPNYKLVGHCQCVPIESPGRTLFEEIKYWENFAAVP